jgi:hypothetical protein
MKFWKELLAVPMALVASQALAENWVTVAAEQHGTSYRESIDKDSIRRGGDGLIYFTVDHGWAGKSDDAEDCQRRVNYTLKDFVGDNPRWRDDGMGISPGSIEEAELQYVCANAG